MRDGGHYLYLDRYLRHAAIVLTLVRRVSKRVSWNCDSSERSVLASTIRFAVIENEQSLPVAGFVFLRLISHS